MFDGGGAKAVLSFLQGAGVGRVVSHTCSAEGRKSQGRTQEAAVCGEPGSCRNPLGPHTAYHPPLFLFTFLLAYSRC